MGKVNCTVRGEDWGWPMSGTPFDPWPTPIPPTDECDAEPYPEHTGRLIGYVTAGITAGWYCKSCTSDTRNGKFLVGAFDNADDHKMFEVDIDSAGVTLREEYQLYAGHTGQDLLTPINGRKAIINNYNDLTPQDYVVVDLATKTEEYQVSKTYRFNTSDHVLNWILLGDGWTLVNPDTGFPEKQFTICCATSNWRWGINLAYQKISIFDFCLNECMPLAHETNFPRNMAGIKRAFFLRKNGHFYAWAKDYMPGTNVIEVNVFTGEWRYAKEIPLSLNKVCWDFKRDIGIMSPDIFLGPNEVGNIAATAKLHFIRDDGEELKILRTVYHKYLVVTAIKEPSSYPGQTIVYIFAFDGVPCEDTEIPGFGWLRFTPYSYYYNSEPTDFVTKVPSVVELEDVNPNYWEPFDSSLFEKIFA